MAMLRVVLRVIACSTTRIRGDLALPLPLRIVETLFIRVIYNYNRVNKVK